MRRFSNKRVIPGGKEPVPPAAAPPVEDRLRAALRWVARSPAARAEAALPSAAQVQQETGRAQAPVKRVATEIRDGCPRSTWGFLRWRRSNPDRWFVNGRRGKRAGSVLHKMLVTPARFERATFPFRSGATPLYAPRDATFPVPCDKPAKLRAHTGNCAIAWEAHDHFF